MTTKRKRSDNQLGWLKTALVVGSLAASLAGTRLVAQKDAAQTAAPPPAAVAPANVVQPIIIPGQNPGANGNAQINLPPVPTIAAPVARPVQPVARTRSSK